MLAERLVQRLAKRSGTADRKGLAIAENQAGQLIGQREDDLEVVDLGQYQLAGLLQPVRSPSTTALRAVAIDARVVHVLSGVTLRTFVHVSLSGRRAAEQDFATARSSLVAPPPSVEEKLGV